MNAPAPHDIAVRAYHLWEEAGRPENSSLHFWLIAEFELMHNWHKLPVSHRRKRYHPDHPFASLYPW